MSIRINQPYLVSSENTPKLGDIWHVPVLDIDVPVEERLNVDTNLVVEGPLIFNVKLESYLHDNLVNCCIFWREKYAIFHLENEYDLK